MNIKDQVCVKLKIFPLDQLINEQCIKHMKQIPNYISFNNSLDQQKQQQEHQQQW